MEEMRKLLKEFAEKATDAEMKALINGINQISCEYGWDNKLEEKDLIKKAYEN